MADNRTSFGDDAIVVIENITRHLEKE